MSTATTDPIASLLAAQAAHPIALLPTHAQARTLAISGSDGMAQLEKLLKMRDNMIAQSEADPLRYGYELDSWKRAEAQLLDGSKELIVLGGNRSAKSEYCAKKVVKTLLGKPKARAWCFHENQKVSRAGQQSRIYKFLPPELRHLGRKGRTTKISYTQANGFTEDTFVMPNGSQCWFMLYSADPRQLEGEELDICWCDELVPLRVLKTLRFRLATRAGLLLVSFTPIEGYTPTVKEALTGAETLEETEARYLPVTDRDSDGKATANGYEMVPLVQQCKRAKARVVYFHTEENPFGNPSEVIAAVDPDNRNEIKVRLYGVTDKPIGNLFPRFKPEIHVVKFDQVAKGGDGTWYHIVDPCNGRNFFMLWAWVNANDQAVIAREWPQEGDYIEGVGYPGPWCEIDPVKLDGAPGEAQKPWGLTLEEYQREIERVEKELGIACNPDGGGDGDVDDAPIEIGERIMDSRFGNTPTLSKSENTTLIEDFDELGLHFEPAPAEHQNEGVTEINDRLGWDARRERGAGNEPSLYVTAGCTNTIWMFENYTGKDGPKGAAKDPYDCVRYLVKSDPEHQAGDGYEIKPGPRLG